ncbi:MAG: serine hydrolase, partial [Elusimicrobiota bacterium]
MSTNYKNYVCIAKIGKCPQLIFLMVFIILCTGYFFYKTGSALDFPFWKKSPRKPSNLQWMIVDDPEWLKMADSIIKLAKSYKGHVGIYLKDFSTDKTLEYKADKLFPSASLIKIPVMASIFRKINGDDFTLETQIKFSEKDRRWGSGSLKWCRSGTKLSVSELLYKM